MAASSPRGPAALVLIAASLGGCVTRERGVSTVPGARPAPAWVEPPPGPPPPEPTGVDCLTHERIRELLDSLRADKGQPAPATPPRLIGADCQKRVYLENGRRYVVWATAGSLHARGGAASTPYPSPTCIERGLARANQVAPFAAAILQRAAAADPQLWRDPEVGAVAYLECDAAEQPDPSSVATMLHETIHHLSSATCNYEFSQDRFVCVEREKGLPEGRIGGYAATPSTLDADAARWFEHVQTTYLVDNGQALWDLLDEVTAYRVEAELGATGAIRQSYANLPLLMAFAARYLDEVGRVDPVSAAKEVGPRGRMRAAVIELLDLGERSYLTWARARPATVFERTFFADYQRARAAWLARP